MFGKSRKSDKKSGKKPGMSLYDIQNSSPEQNLTELENNVATAITNADGQNNFFCTDESFITKFDDSEILKYIQINIPDFGINPGCTAFKQSIFNFLEDDQYVRLVMKKFELEVNDLFKFLFRLEPAVFKGMFMKRVKEIVARKKYSKVHV